jgi:hypothetical protein
MPEQERTNLEEAVIVMRSQLETLTDQNRERTTWMRLLFAAFAVQFLVTVFLSGVKWAQVDRLISDVARIETQISK